MQDRPCSIWIGWDPREAAAFAVARASIRRRLTQSIPIHGLILERLRARGLYWRAHEKRGNQLWDVISQAPMSTEFAISRFLVPTLARQGWALFLDADMLALGNLTRLFEHADPRFAVMCVHHQHEPIESTKMDGRVQTVYPRKNWSSLMLFNCDHPSNKPLTPELVNGLPGRDLHRFCWLDDHEIGELDVRWNWLVGSSPEHVVPEVVHFTGGGPWFAGFEDVPYAQQWRDELAHWAGGNHDHHPAH